MAKRRRVQKRKHPLSIDNIHDEHKLLLFVTGLAFGVGLSTSIYNLWFPSVVAMAVVIILWMIDKREGLTK